MPFLLSSHLIVSFSYIHSVQPNAYPPKPKASMDLYTSSIHGEASITLTILVQTSVTRYEETPHLHIELLMAPMMKSSN
jgi:hypothetical protein